MEFAVT